MKAKQSDQFFEEFKAIRKSKRFSINDISKAIKLQKEYIKAIESGNFDILSPVYIRLFIKSYSEYLEMDVNKILRLYGDYISGKSKNKTSEETPKFIDKKSKGAYNKILAIGSKSSDNLINHYSRDPKKIVALSSVILMIIVCWIILARVSTTTHDNYKIKFDKQGVLQAFIFTNILVLMVGMINCLLGSNYMFLCAPPDVNNPFLIGEWPYYLLILELIFFIYGYVLLVPFLIIKYLNKNK